MIDFNLPHSCKVEKFIAKKVLIEKTPKGTKKFEQIEKITWLYKLSPTTLHLPKQGKVEEIHIFSLLLKSKEYPKDAIESIKRLISYPILFEIKHNNDFCYATYGLESSKVLFSAWNEPLAFDFNGTNLEKVYENMVKKFLSLAVQSSKVDLKTALEREQQVAALTKEIEALKKKIAKEKQFKKQLALSVLLKPKELELKNLIGELYTKE